MEYGKQKSSARGWRDAAPRCEGIKKKLGSVCSDGRCPPHRSVHSGHEGSKGLFVLDVSREWVRGDEVAHGDEGNGWFFVTGPWDWPVAGGERVVMGCRACVSCSRDHLWSRIVVQGRKVAKTIAEPRHVTRLVVHAPWITGRDREILHVMIKAGWRSEDRRGCRIWRCLGGVV